MKIRKYRASFTLDDEYVIYFWVLNNYISFPLNQKEKVENVISFPENVIDDKDHE